MTANSLIEDTLERIDKAYQPGTLPWMKMNRLDEWSKTVALERRITKTALDGNLEGLREALDEYQGLILARVKEFRTSKEVEGQGSFNFAERPESPWDG